MLQIFRDKSQSTFIQAIVLVIALVFIFWGVGANMMDSREAAIVVNDEEISYQQYQRLYDQLLTGYRQQFGGSVPDELLKSLGLSEQVKRQLIQQTLLRQGAASMGLIISEPEVKQDIRKMVQFQDNDTFNLDKYRTILSSNQLSPHKYEVTRRVDMLSTKAVQTISNFATTVTDAEINDVFKQSRESVSVQFVTISPLQFADKVTMEDDVLTSWFAQNKQNYKSAPQVKLKFLSFPYKADSESDKAVATANRSDVFKQADAAYEGIITAGSLQAYAQLHPDGVVLETDFFPMSSLPANLDNSPVVQNKAFALKVGELSSLIESPAGYTILYAEAIQEPQIPTLEDVRDRVTKDYRSERSEVLAQEKSAEMLVALKADTSFAEICTQNNLELKETTLFRNATVPNDSGFPSSLLRDVFSLSENNSLPEEPAKVARDIYLYKFAKRTLPDVSEITDKEKEQLKTQLLSAKQERILIAWIRNQEKRANILSNKNIQ